MNLAKLGGCLDGALNKKILLRTMQLGLKKSEYDLLGEKAHSPPNIIIFNFSDAYSFDTMDRSFDLPILVFLQK